MNRFIGRYTELKEITESMNQKSLCTMLVYGRRRIGKTELIKHAINNNKKKNTIYYECKNTTEANNVESLSQIISNIFDLPNIYFKSFEDVLDYLFKKSIDEKSVLVLDEYSYLKNIIKGIDSIVQSLIDKYKNKSKLTLILCGSYIDIMKSILNNDNPLYGRINKTINLRQMNYLECSQFYKKFSNEEKIMLYSVFGGVPYYNSMIDDSLSVKDNIIKLIASPGAILQNEISMYLSSQISKISNANVVFDTLAAGFSKFKDILDQSHVSSAPTLADTLNKLIDMDLVEKTVPINEKNNKNKTYYDILDNLSSFYYRYVSKYSSQMNYMSINAFYNKYIKKDFESLYVPKQFEKISKQYLILQNIKGNIKPIFEDIGKYFYNNPSSKTNGEFDIVTRDEKGYIFYEAKFTKNQITDKIITEEIRQVDNTSLDCYKYGFISKNGFNLNKYINDNRLILITLDDIYKL